MPMSTGTKRILAIVVVAVIAVGVVGVYLVITPSGPQYETPGMPAGVPSNRIIKIGLLDPMTEIQGKSAREGALLAIKEINGAGGITINGTVYYLGLIAEDTYEADPALDVSKGVAAAQKIITVDAAQFIIGGFRTESLKAYVEVVMDHKLVMIGTGASTDYFCQNVLDSYNRYKYWFRGMPINSTMLGKETITMLYWLRGNMSLRLGRTVKYWAILRENLDWTVPMANALKSKDPLKPGLGLLGWNSTPAIEIAYPITAGSAEFATYLSQINASKAQVLIPIISAQGGQYLMTQYNATKPWFLPIGIDVQSQVDTFWTATNGKCAYEVCQQALVENTPKTPTSIAFWNHYKGNYTHDPLYTGVGSYDAVNLLAYAIGQSQSLTSANVVTALESIKAANYSAVGNSIIGSNSRLSFTRSHDVLEGYNYLKGILWGVSLWAQWHPDGKKYCVTTGGILYPDSIVTGQLLLPPWGINYYP